MKTVLQSRIKQDVLQRRVRGTDSCGSPSGVMEITQVFREADRGKGRNGCNDIL